MADPHGLLLDRSAGFTVIENDDDVCLPGLFQTSLPPGFIQLRAGTVLVNPAVTERVLSGPQFQRLNVFFEELAQFGERYGLSPVLNRRLATAGNHHSNFFGFWHD